MKYRIFLLLLAGISFSANAYPQTDIGSASSGGAVTTDQSLAAMTPSKRLKLQEQELSIELKKLEAHAQQISVNSLALADTDRQAIEKAYDAFRKAGHEMSPFDFLATTIAIQALPQGNLPDKNATAVKAELESTGIKNGNIALFSQIEGEGGQTATKSTSKEYKESLDKAKNELHKALK